MGKKKKTHNTELCHLIACLTLHRDFRDQESGIGF